MQKYKKLKDLYKFQFLIIKKSSNVLELKFFLMNKVGILLTIKIDVIKIAVELIIAVFSNRTKPLKFKIRGIKINPAAAGDGTPWKKFIFQISVSSFVVKLNLAKRRAQHKRYKLKQTSILFFLFHLSSKNTLQNLVPHQN